MEDKNDLKEKFEKEIEILKQNTVLSPEYRKKKVIIWFIRTIIAALLFYIFWDTSWVRTALYFYVPLNLFSLFSIFGWTSFLKNKIKNTEHNLEELDKIIQNTEYK